MAERREAFAIAIAPAVTGAPPVTGRAAVGTDVAAPAAAVARVQDQRFGYIDSLRGLACLLVVYLHSVQWLSDTPFVVGAGAEAVLRWSTETIDPGKIGVLMFFIISGYVVPFSLLRPRAAPVRDFMISRFFRLYPIYWLSIAVGALAVHTYLGIATDAATLLANLTMIQAFLGEPHVLRIYWSLQVELIFYGLCVAMFLLGGMRDPRAPGLVALGFLIAAVPAAALRHVLELPLPVGLPLALSLMFFGFAIRQYRNHASDALRLQVHGLLGLYLLALPAICYVAYASVIPPYGTWTAYLWSYYIAISVVCAVVLIRQVSTSLSAWVGRISYSVYLFHLVLVHVLGYYLVQLLPAGTPGVPLLLVFPTASLIVSHLLFVHVELPSIRLGRALTRRLG